MSDLRTRLNEWAAVRGSEVAAALVAGDSQVLVRHQVTRRKRVRGAGVAGGVIVVVAALFALVVPALVGGGSALPAATGSPTVELVAGQVPGGLSCGAAWTMKRGVTQHSDKARGEVAGTWSKRTDGGEEIANPDSLWAGYDSLQWYQKSHGAGNDNGMMLATVVAVQDGSIVGVAPVTGARVKRGVVEFGMDAPLPGVCGSSEASAPDGTYTFHVVIQLLSPDGELVATWVDPSGPITVDITDLEGLLGQPAGPTTSAKLTEPVGDSYQAFVMPAPTSASCTPYADELAAGQPSAYNLQYPVTIPGVQPITGDVWSKAPAVIIDDPAYQAWYTSLPAGIIAEHVSDGNPTATVGWTTGSTWGETTVPGTLRLINSPDAQGIGGPNPAQGCNFTAPIPDVSGAVFLVIDGVDVDAAEAANPGVSWAQDPATLQTWVYLGQAS